MRRSLLAAALLTVLAPPAATAAPGSSAGSLAARLSAAHVAPGSVREVRTTTSLGSRITRLRQLSGGVPVLGGEVVVVDAPGRRGDLVVDGRRRVRTPAAPLVARARALSAARARIGARTLRAAPVASLAILPGAGGGRLVWRVLLSTTRPLGSWEVLVDARTSTVVRTRDRLRRATGSAGIFDPNPVTTLGGTAGLADF